MPALISSRADTANRDERLNPDQDIQNDITFRESAYIADKLLKKLTPAQPVFHHTELVPIRQNRAEAPTAQIKSPKASGAQATIQKPAPPRVANVGSKLHFNNNLPIPQLQHARYLGRRKESVEVELDHTSAKTQTKLSRRAQTFPLRNNAPSNDANNLYTVDEKTKITSQDHNPSQNPSDHLKRAGDHVHTPGPFPLYPSQRLPPPVPSIPTETAAAVYSHMKRSHSQPTIRKAHGYHRQEAGGSTKPSGSVSTKEKEGDGKILVTGKRRPGQGVSIDVRRSITVPIIGPPPAGRRWRNKGEGSMKGVLEGEPDTQSGGWEKVEVRGGGT